MVYHGELAKLKPGPRHLTSFYLSIAAGGAFGTLLVGLMAPYIFPAIWEFQIGLWTSGFVIAMVLWPGVPADGIIWIRPEDFGPLNQQGWTRIE